MVMFLENSELSPVMTFVAAALTVCPRSCPIIGKVLVQEKSAFPLVSVDT
jgi:hypothetical protein